MKIKWQVKEEKSRYYYINGKEVIERVPSGGKYNYVYKGIEYSTLQGAKKAIKDVFPH